MGVSLPELCPVVHTSGVHLGIALALPGRWGLVFRNYVRWFICLPGSWRLVGVFRVGVMFRGCHFVGISS